MLPAEGYREPPSVLGPAAAALASGVLAAGDPARFGSGEQFLLVPPELAGLLAGSGWTADRAAAWLFEEGNALVGTGAAALAGRTGAAVYAAGPLRVAASPADVHLVVTGGPGVKMALLPTWMGGTRSVTAPVLPL